MGEPEIKTTIACQSCSDIPECDEKLLSCSACKWAVYCNADCQKQHWPDHKKLCKKIALGRQQGRPLPELLAALSLTGDTTKIDIPSVLPPPTRDTIAFELLYPVLPIIVHSANARQDYPSQRMLEYQVDRVVQTPNSRQISFSKDLPYPGGMNPQTWFPSAPVKKAYALWRRVLWEGWTIEKSLGLTMAMFRALSEKDIGLTYHGDLIVDYGISSGRFRVVSEDRLSYKLPDGKVFNAQNPDDHHWVYLQTSKGEIIFLDVCLFVFNYGLGVGTAPYLKEDPALAQAMPEKVPCFLIGRDMLVGGAWKVHTEDESKRYSVVKSPLLTAASTGLSPRGTHRSASKAINEICSIIRDGRGDNCPPQLITNCVSAIFREATGFFGRMLERRSWTRYPKDPPQCIITTENEYD